jgi:DNA-binding response OmpR family regulator
MARFLVIDDDHATVHGLTSLLADDGHAVSACTSGADAVQALSRESYDAVLTDLDMPHPDGRVVVEVARESQPEACLWVTGVRAGGEARALVKAGACTAIDKPIDYDEMHEAIIACRKRGGPGPERECHLRSKALKPIAVRPKRR